MPIQIAIPGLNGDFSENQNQTIGVPGIQGDLQQNSGTTSVSQIIQLPLDFKGNVGVVYRVPIEYTAVENLVSRSFNINLEWSQKYFSRLTPVPFENRTTINIVRTVTLPFDFKGSLYSKFPLPVEFFQRNAYVARQAPVNIDWLFKTPAPPPLPVFPTLIGLTWPVKKTAKWDYRAQKSISGIEFRAVNQTLPLWSWELNYSILRDKWDTRSTYAGGLGTGYDELRTLAGFFNQLNGGTGLFLFNDLTDNNITNQTLGTGDGQTQIYQLVRTFGSELMGGGYAEQITNYNVINHIYLNGINQVDNFSVDPNSGLVTFNTIVPSGAVITADFSYYFLCRFDVDGMNFEYFMYQLWQNKSVKFIKVIL
jgi:uncharacterized protein (TIGR02217 family)